MSESNRVIGKITEETVYGVTPTAATWDTIRWTGSSLNATPNTTESQEIRSDRMTVDMPKVGITVDGGFDFELTPSTLDDLMEAVMCGTWTTDVLKVGTTDRSFTIEEEFADIGKFINFKGMRANSLDLNISFGEIITGSITFAGNGYATPASSAVGAGTLNAATTSETMTASSDVGTIKFDGVLTGICIKTLNLSINNNLRSIDCIGRETAKDQVKGKSSITGSMEMYLKADSFDIYEKMINNDAIEIEYVVDDGVNSYTFLIPNAKLSGDAPRPEGLDSDVMLTANFTALYDATESTNLKITRT